MTTRAELRSMLTGFRLSAALSVAAELGISDLLAEGPRTLDELAGATSTDPDTLLRLLRALATVGIYDRREGDTFTNTPLGEGLRSDVQASMRPLARTLQDPAVWAAWGHLRHSVSTGENAFAALHGTDVWSHRETHPNHNATFNDNMTMLSSLVADAVATAYDFGGLSTVVDVGGGHGILLATILSRHPHLTGTVFDLEQAVTDHPPAAAAAALASRWTVATGSFFERVPSGDALVLKSVLHDWPDDRCVEILEICREALPEKGVVLVVETVLGRPGHEVIAAFSDLNMLVLPGGRERTEDEYAALFDAAGLRLTRTVDTGTQMSILEAGHRPR
ncbi:MAG: methyltransferase [Nocardioides sp.]